MKIIGYELGATTITGTAEIEDVDPGLVRDPQARFLEYFDLMKESFETTHVRRKQRSLPLHL